MPDRLGVDPAFLFTVDGYRIDAGDDLSVAADLLVQESQVIGTEITEAGGSQR